MVRTRQPRTERAIDIVDREIERTTAEREAFTRFLGRLDGVEPSRPEPGTDVVAAAGGLTVPTVGGQSADEPLRTVRAAYRETVMDVPHYEAEYDETLRENLAAEVGADLATGVVDGKSLTPVVYDGLVAACEQARDERDEFLRVLQLERESLCAVRRTLDGIESRVTELGERVDRAETSDSLAALDHRLITLERECADLSEQRQGHIHERSIADFSGVDDDSLSSYLYAALDTQCPALRDIADCLGTVRDHRERCLR